MLDVLGEYGFEMAAAEESVLSRLSRRTVPI